MKNLLIYTNCQGVEIKKYLESINSFNEDYRVISVFMPHWFNDSSVLNGGVNEMKILPNGLKDLLKTIFTNHFHLEGEFFQPPVLIAF